MASNQTSATALIALVKQRAYQPANGGPTDTAILRDLNAELLTYVVPLMTNIGEEFFVDLYPFTTVQNQDAYDIPADSIASKIRDVQVLADDNVSWVSIAHEEPERAATYALSSQRPMAYIIRANKIILLPKPTVTGQAMRMAYYRRPRELVNSGYSALSSFSAASPPLPAIIGVSSTSGMAGTGFDLIDSTTSEVILSDFQATVIDPTTLNSTSLTDDEASTLAQYALSGGATVIVTGTSPIVDVPPEAAVLLAQRVASLVLQEQADPRMAQAFAEVERVKYTLQTLFAPRASGRARKVVNRNGPGWGSWRWGYRRWWS